MTPMLKPQKLRAGDKVAAVTLSWAGPGCFPHRFVALPLGTLYTPEDADYIADCVRRVYGELF